jgi:PAS domain S-box-containing protein
LTQKEKEEEKYKNGLQIRHFIIIFLLKLITVWKLWSLVPFMGDTILSTILDCIQNCGVSAEEWYENIYDSSPVLYRTINTDGIILDCNRAYVKALGYLSKEELIGTSIFDCTAEQSLDEMHKTFETWRKAGHVQNREVCLKRKDGTTFPALLNASSIFDEMGTLVASNTVITNVTEIHNTRKALEEANRELRTIER